MPESSDIDKIVRMLKDVGEKELEIGNLEQVAGESIQEETRGVTEESAREVSPESERQEEKELLDLLKDIEIGLSEERELEAKLHREEEIDELLESPESAASMPAVETREEPSEEDRPVPAYPPAEARMPEEEILEQEGEEEGFDLPADFDMSMLGIDEGVPTVLPHRPAESAGERQAGLQAAPSREETGEGEETPGAALEEGTTPAERIEAAIREVEEAPEELIEEFEMPELEELETLEELQKRPGEEVPPGRPEGEEEKPFEIESEEEMPSLLEEEGEEPAASKPAAEAELLRDLDEVIEAPAASMPAAEAEPGFEAEPAFGRAPDIELSDEDIVLITTTLKQLSPAVARQVRDLIVNVGLPPEQMAELLQLLIRDEPAEEIVRFIESATGRRIAPVYQPEEMAAPAVRRGRIATAAGNLAPIVRVAGLFIAILAILGILFMVTLYKPIKSNRFYRDGVLFLRSENYQEAEKNFQKAVDIYPKIREYDIYGWEYMLAGNYDAAEQKFKSGMSLDEKMRVLSLREHLAQLYNILHRYDKADELYGALLAKKPGDYRYQKSKGLNLVDWGGEDKTKLDEAYSLFQSVYAEKGRNSDPLFQLLRIDILRRNEENINYLFGVLKRRFPQDVDRDVYTALASYYISIGHFGPVWDILASVVDRYPDFPKAYYVFANFENRIGDKSREEDLLKTAIDREKNRELRYPWETRDRELLSGAYNDLGELYAGMEVEGKTAEAIGYFKEAIDINDKNSSAYFNLAQTYFYKEKNYDLARRYYERARALGMNNDDLRFNLGLLYYYGKDFEGALRQWSRMGDVMPDNPNVGFAVGNAFLQMGKYNAALGEFLMLSERFDGLVRELGEIKPWIAYHKKIVLGASAVYNNLGVTYEKLYESTGNRTFQKESLVSLYRAGELADIAGTDRGIVQYNINYIIHPNVVRADMAINNNISTDYRFVAR